MRKLSYLLVLGLFSAGLFGVIHGLGAQEGPGVEELLRALEGTEGVERIETLHPLVMELQREERIEESLAYTLEAEELARELDRPKDRAHALQLIGDAHNLLGNLEEGIRFLTQSADLFEGLGLLEDVAWIRPYLCSHRTRPGQYAEALEDCFEAYEFFSSTGDLNGQAGALNNIAGLYLELDQSSEALGYYEEALEIIEQTGHQGRLARVLNNIGVIYQRQGEFEQALGFLERSLHLKRELGDERGVVRRLLNLGTNHIELNDLVEARKLFTEALDLSKSIGYRTGEASSLHRLAVLADAEGDLPKAADLLQQALGIVEETGEGTDARAWLQTLARIYKEMGRYKEAFEVLERYDALEREVAALEKTEALAEMQARFETQQKQQRIELLEREQAFSELELSRQRSAWYVLLVGAILVLAIVLLLVNRYRLATREAMMEARLEREHEVSTRLREVDRLKDEFLANTSHELRTPLYGIVGLADSLVDGAAGHLPPTAQANLRMISSSGRRLSALVGDLLDFSKLRHAGIELARRPVGLRALTEVVLTVSRPLVEGKELVLSNHVDEELPAAFADENRIHQVLLNLVSNAIKFTDRGEVKVSAEPVGEELMVQVADTGLGISPEKLKSIFESFEQGEASSERQFGGTGLGLAISRQLVERHGGKIWAESDLGQGATFSFTLPMVTPDRLRASQEPHTEVAALLEPRGTSPAVVVPEMVSEGPLILTVGDEPVVRQVLLNHLSAAGYRLRQAATGRAALEALEEESFDLILLDVMMPRMSGYEVCRRIRQHHTREELPIVFLSAKTQEEDHVTGLAEGANDYLQ